MILENLKSLEKSINAELSSKIKNSSINNRELLIEINEIDLIHVVQFLKSNENCKFRQLIDIAGVDYPEDEKRFELVYLFLSHENNTRIKLLIKFELNQSNYSYYLFNEPLFLIFFCNCIIPYNNASAEGGHPGT